MLEKAMVVLEKLGNALPNMTEYQKGYLMGTLDAMGEKQKITNVPDDKEVKRE